MRRYLLPAAAAVLLYAANRFVLLPITSGPLHILLAWYFADFLAGGLMLCILNALLAAAKRPPLTRVLPVSAFLLACGGFWEYVTPLYLPRSVSDPRDILAVWLGGMAMLFLQAQRKTRP